MGGEYGYDIGSSSQGSIIQSAINVAKEGCDEIKNVLADIQVDNILGNDEVTEGAVSPANDNDSGRNVLDKYGITGNANVTQASGAMVIDDLMQRISTKVQVASQMLATSNNISKTASRIISQG